MKQKTCIGQSYSSRYCDEIQGKMAYWETHCVKSVFSRMMLMGENYRMP